MISGRAPVHDLWQVTSAVNRKAAVHPVAGLLRCHRSHGNLCARRTCTPGEPWRTVSAVAAALSGLLWVGERSLGFAAAEAALAAATMPPIAAAPATAPAMAGAAIEGLGIGNVGTALVVLAGAAVPDEIVGCREDGALAGRNVGVAGAGLSGSP